MLNFTEPASLHNHSKYSLLDAIPSPEEWVGWCLESGTPGFAVTDHGTAMSMFHARRFPEYIEKYNKKHGTAHAKDSVVGIPAVELYVTHLPEDKSNFHITVWATSNEGFRNLTKLASLAFNNVVYKFGSPKPRVTFDQILEYKAGLSFGSGCIVGPIGSAVWDGDYVEAERMYLKYQEWFGDQLYIEFHPTNITHDFDRKVGGFVPIDECACGPDKQLAYNTFLKSMVDKHGGKPIPVTDAHFIKAEDKPLQDLILKKGNETGWHFYESYHAKQAEEIYATLSKQLGADWLTREKFQGWIENTYEVMNAAKSIDIEFPFIMPEVEIPTSIKSQHTSYESQTKALLTELCKTGGRWRHEVEYQDRFAKELAVICDNGTLSFAPYFLLYHDICNYAWSIGELTGPGRGSAGGCLISYYLNIVHLDPIAEDLPFERFLSLERIKNKKFPDIDVDFSNREPILKYLAEKWGLGFSQICTYQTMKIRSAIYDAMSHLHGAKRNDPKLWALCTNLPDAPGVDSYDAVYGFTDKEGNYHAGFVETHPPLAAFFAQYPDVEAMVKRLLGFISAVGRHASAYVVSSKDLEIGLTPTMTIKGAKATQFDAPMIEANGLVKADLLGIKTLGAVAEAVKLIKTVDYLERNEHGVPLLFRLPEDPAVYADLNNLDVDSVFQFNTDLIKGYIKRFNPQSRAHLSALTALCRPGALDAIFVNDEITAAHRVTAVEYYIQVRNGKRKLSLLHPDLEACTHNGIFVYQEDIKKFFEYVGFSSGEAEQIMAGVAKKKLSDIQKGFDKARIDLPLKGWTTEQVETVLAQITAFAKYSFNRSHSRAYSDLGYQTAYLKHHHPLEWWTAMLNAENESDSTNKEDKIRHFISLLGNMVQGPSLKHTSTRFTIKDGKIISPVSVLKRVGDAAAEELVAKGPFSSIEDFVKRCDARKVNAGVLQALVRGRAADDLMDPTMEYGTARSALLDSYAKFKKCKTIAPEMYDTTPLNIFLQEMETSTVFNKPFACLFPGEYDTIAKAERLKSETVMVLQLVSKEKRNFISKAGNLVTMQKCIWSDGMQTVESVRFKEEHFVGVETESLCKVTGSVARGFANKLQLSIEYATILHGPKK